MNKKISILITKKSKNNLPISREK